jgi:hypothetical protein
MGWWLQLIGLILGFVGVGFTLYGFIISPQETIVQSVRNLFSEQQSIKVLPPSLGGNDVLNLNNLATLKLHVPYSEQGVTLLLDVVPEEHPPVKNENFSVEGIRIYNHASGEKFFFDKEENKRKEITIGDRTFVVTLLKIKKLDFKNVAEPFEFVFGISEKK